MVLLEGDHPVLQDTSRLLVLGHLDPRISLKIVKDEASRVEQVKHVLKPRVSSQVDPIDLEVRCREAWHGEQVDGLVSHQLA